ncbi:MAG TPA: hypothetical protein VME40_10710 [Caulobacteraceae bacterium]|nr:hypothetical protein [Caulobacteraceae bacterium]
MVPFLLALTLMTAAPPTDDGDGEPLPPGAPTDSYELSAWCYGALGEYLAIYEKVKPDLRDIDRMFGTSVVEAEPYQSDMAAYRVELKLIGDSVTDAEKASPDAISDRGVAAMRRGREIWSVAEQKTSRELARAWLGWSLPDRCDTNARELATRSIVLGRALRYNQGDNAAPPPMTPETAPPMSGHGAPAPPPPDTVSAAFANPLPSGPPTQAASGPPAATEPPASGTPAGVKSEPPPAALETVAPSVETEAPGPIEPPQPESQAQAAVSANAPDAGDTRTAAQAPVASPPPAATQTTPPAAAATGASGPDEPQEPTL